MMCRRGRPGDQPDPDQADRRPRRLRPARQRVCGAGAQGHPGPLRSRFHAIRPGRRHPRQSPQQRGPPGQGPDAARGSIRRDDRRGRRVRLRAPVAPAEAMSAAAEERPPDAVRRWNAVIPWEGEGYCLPSNTPRSPRMRGAEVAYCSPAIFQSHGSFVVETGLAGGVSIRIERP